MDKFFTPRFKFYRCRNAGEDCFFHLPVLTGARDGGGGRGKLDSSDVSDCKS